MILSVLCYEPPFVELIGLTSLRF